MVVLGCYNSGAWWIVMYSIVLIVGSFHVLRLDRRRDILLRSSSAARADATWSQSSLPQRRGQMLICGDHVSATRL